MFIDCWCLLRFLIPRSPLPVKLSGNWWRIKWYKWSWTLVTILSSYQLSMSTWSSNWNKISLFINWSMIPIFTFWVPCWDVRYDFNKKTMFGSSLPPVVCRRSHILFTFLVFVCVYWCPTYFVLFCFEFCSSSCVPCVASCSGLSFLIAHSVFSNVYSVSNTSEN
jgi:hypothetical protein